MAACIIRILLAGAAILLGAAGVRAHIPEQIVVDLDLKDESWIATSEMDVKFAVVALMHHYLPPDTGSGWLANLNPGQLGLVREVTEKLYRERFQLMEGGRRLELEFAFPDYETSPVNFGIGENEEPVVRVVMKGEYSGSGGPMTVRWEGKWGPTLALMVRRNGTEEPPPVVTVGLGETVDLGPRGDGESGRTSRGASLPQWVRHGFEQLVLKGPVLFLLALVLLVPRRNPILVQMACFTVAHSLTLWVATLGFLHVPAGIVTPFLAVGIVYLGLENLFLERATPWRLGVVTGLGLVYGIGFATVVRELPVPSEGLAMPLAGFHLGLEVGQVAIVALAILLLRPLLKKEFFAKVRTLGSAAIAAVGLFWAVELLVV